MKIKDGFIYRQIAGEHMIIPVGSNIADFNGIISLNETAAFLWKELQNGSQPEALVASVQHEYEVDAGQAKQDIDEFLALLREHKVIADE